MGTDTEETPAVPWSPRSSLSSCPGPPLTHDSVSQCAASVGMRKGFNVVSHPFCFKASPFVRCDPSNFLETAVALFEFFFKLSSW